MATDLFCVFVFCFCFASTMPIKDRVEVLWSMWAKNLHLPELSDASCINHQPPNTRALLDQPNAPDDSGNKNPEAGEKKDPVAEQNMMMMMKKKGWR